MTDSGMQKVEIDTDVEKKLAALALFIDGKKGEEISIMDLRSIHSYLNYFMIVSANSVIHARSLAKEIRNHLSVFEIDANGVPDDQSPDWIVIDCFWLIIHIFIPDTRRFFALDKLWADARQIEWKV